MQISIKNPLEFNQGVKKIDSILAQNSDIDHDNTKDKQARAD